MYRLRWFASIIILLTGMLAASRAYAVAVDVANLMGLPWPQLAIGAGIAFWGGLTRTAQRALEASQEMRDAIEEGLPAPRLFRLGYEVWRDFMLSGGISLIMFAIGSSMNLGNLQMGALIWFSGYLGPMLLIELRNLAVSEIRRRGGSS